MVNLTIDDKLITAPKNATIYDAAKSAGIKIPVICHDKKLNPFGGCRMCLVEVEQMKGRQIPACTTPVTEGMIVRTSTEEIIKARKMVLELLLLKHPIDCPVCDAAGDCDLQNLTYEYKVNTNRFTDEKFNWKIDYENPLIERDMNRCVHCGKCARICDEIVCHGSYSFINRGINAKIGTEFDGPLNCEFCGSCVSVCPVGALISRPFKFKARWWALNKVKSVCGYCGTGCQLTLGVKDNKVMTTIYDENQGFHNGQLCTRGRWGYQFINSPERLTTPLVKKNGTLQPASWDEALTLVAGRLKDAKVQPDTLAALVTPRLTNEELLLLRKLIKDQLGCDNIDHSAGYAHAALTEGARESLGYPSSSSKVADIQKANLLLVIKNDAYDTHPVVGFEINLAVKRQGADIRILSDKRGKLSKLPDAKTYIHSPGVEVAVLNAMARAILDSNLYNAEAAQGIGGFNAWQKSIESCSIEQAAALSGISADEIKTLASDYANADKALILMPTGLGYPGHNKELAQAIINLALLTGKIGKEGSGVLILGEKNNSQGASDLTIHPTSGGKNAQAIIAGCTSGAIKTLLIVGENPVVSYPNRKLVEDAISKTEFVIAQDLFLTETAALADVVLPVCSFAEKTGTFTSALGNVQRLNRAVSPVGESRSDFQVLNDLYTAVSGESAFMDTKSAFDEIARTVPGYEGLSFDALGEDGIVRPVNGIPAFVPVATQSIASETGKLALVTGSALNHCGTLSLHGEGPMLVCPEAYIEISRDDARTMSIKDGESVSVKSSTGELRLKAKVGSRLEKGVVFVPYHFAAASINTVTSGASVTWVTIGK